MEERTLYEQRCEKMDKLTDKDFLRELIVEYFYLSIENDGFVTKEDMLENILEDCPEGTKIYGRYIEQLFDEYEDYVEDCLDIINSFYSYESERLMYPGLEEI